MKIQRQIQIAGVILASFSLLAVVTTTGCYRAQAETVVNDASDAKVDQTVVDVASDATIEADAVLSWEQKKENDRLAEERRALEQMQAKIARQQEELARTQRMLDEKAKSMVDVVEQDPVVESPVETEDVIETEPEVEVVEEVVDVAQDEIVYVNLPATTPIVASIEQAISSETNVVGDPIEAFVAADVVMDDLTVIPAGSRLTGRIAEILEPTKKVGGSAEMVMTFDELQLADGQSVALFASARESRKQAGKDAATIGGAAAGGAVLGRILKDDDRDKGTIVGAILGAAIGTAVAAKNKARPVEIEPGQIVEVSLEQPTQIAVNLPNVTEEVAEVRSFPRRTP